MKKQFGTLESEIREFFEIKPDTALLLIRTDWEHSDGRNASPFIKRLIKAARIAATVENQGSGGGA